jgi:transcriptional regulator NrdR family protein
MYTEDAIRRRRMCLADNGHRFITYERAIDHEARDAAHEAMRLEPAEAAAITNAVDRVLARAFRRLTRNGGPT